jgi:hypothetical protein
MSDGTNISTRSDHCPSSSVRSVTESAFMFDDAFVMCVAVFIISAGVVLKEGFVAL